MLASRGLSPGNLPAWTQRAVNVKGVCVLSGPRYREALLQLGCGAAVILPLKHQRKIFAVLMLGWPRPAGLTPARRKQLGAWAAFLEAALAPRAEADQSPQGEALEDSRLRYELALRGANDGIWDWNLKTGEVHYSSRCREMLGYSAHEFDNTAFQWRKLVHPDDEAKVMDLIRDHFRGRTPFFINEHRLRHRDGSWRWVLERGLGQRDARGRVFRMAGSWTDITERRESEDALRRGEAQLRTIISNVPIVLFAYDPQGRFTFSDGKGLERLGLKTGEVVGLSVLDLYKDTPEVVANVRRALRGESFTSINRVGDLTYQTWYNPRFKSDGSLDGVIGVAVDMSEQERIQRELVESRRMLSTLVSNLPGVAYRCLNDPLWTVVFISDGIKDLSGWEPGDFIGSAPRATYAGIIHPEDRDRVWNEVQKALEWKGPFRMMYRIVTRHQQVKWVWEQGSGVFNANGELEALEGFITDITERREANEAMRLSEARLRTIISSLPVILFAYDTDARLTLSEGRGLERLGLKPGQLVGANFRELYKDSPKVLDDIRRALSGESFFTINEDQGRVYHVWHTPLKDAEGNVREVLGLTLDVTVLSRAQQSAESARQRLSEKNEELEFAFDQIAHDLRNPLFAMRGYIELLGRTLPSEGQETVRKSLENLGESLMRAIGLADDLQAVGQAGKLEFKPEEITLREAVDHILKEQIQRNGCDPESLCNRTDGARIRFDPRQLYVVLSNLVGNAIKYASPSRGCEVEIALEQRDGFDRITVADKGPGIRPEEIKRVWEPFYRSRSTNVDGSGVGLAVVKRLVERAGGRVGVESEVGRGSTFWVEIPRATA